MRAKRSKKYRKIMQTYEQTFGFRPPYQVLVSASFIRACAAFKMPLLKSLENTLQVHGPGSGGAVRMFVTKCTLAGILTEEKERRRKSGESERKGNPRPEWLPPPTELPLRYCDHSKKSRAEKADGDEEEEEEEGGGIMKEEWKCLVDLIAGQPRGNEEAKNKQHFVLATAEDLGPTEQRRRRDHVDVREKARMVPGVPVVYVKRSVMVLEELSGASERVRRGVEKGKFKEGLLSGAGADRKRKRGEGEEEEEDDEGGNVDEGRALLMKKPKSKGPKQPNPLSVPKKKKVIAVQKSPANVLPAVEDVNREPEDAISDRELETAEAPVKKGRKRRHGKKKSNIDEFREALLEPDVHEPTLGLQEAPLQLRAVST